MKSWWKLCVLLFAWLAGISFTHAVPVIPSPAGNILYRSSLAPAAPPLTSAVTKTDLYEAFGNITTSTGTSSNNRLANTKERSFALGLDNHGFRYYDPDVGRYLTRDPIGYGDGLNVYLYVHNNPINRVDPLGLTGDKAIYDEIQRIADDVEAMTPQQLGLESGATERQIGSRKHKVFQERVEGLNKTIGNNRILTERSINQAGEMAGYGEKFSRRPDVILLKEGETIDTVAKGGLAGRVKSVVDFKTGGAEMKTGWADDVIGRLGIGRHMVHEVKKGEQLASKFSSAITRAGAFSSKAGRKALGPLTATAFVALAYTEAKAAGFTDSQAAAYAVASIGGGDVAYDVMMATGDAAWAKANTFARTSAGGRYISAINQEVFGIETHGGNVPQYLQNDRSLDALLRQHEQGAGGRGY